MFVDEFIALKHLYSFSRGGDDERSAEKNARRISSFLSESVPRLELIIFFGNGHEQFSSSIISFDIFQESKKSLAVLSGLFTFGQLTRTTQITHKGHLGPASMLNV